MKQKYRHTFRCPCGTVFKKISTSPDLQAASCPECKKKEAWRNNTVGDGPVSDSDLVETRPFLHTDRYTCFSCRKDLMFRVEQEDDKMAHCYHCGSQDIKRMGTIVPHISSISKDHIKAIDIVAEGTMKSYAMTDLNLNSGMREGDSCAPKLPPAQQQAVDGFFDHGKNPSLKGANLNAIGKRAIAGAYRDPNNPVAAAHRARMRPGTEGKFVDATPGRR